MPPEPGRQRRGTAVLSLVLLAVLGSTFIQLVDPTPAAAAPAKPVVYLTFDDGPGPSTPAFLDLLGGYGIKGTFFVTGRAVSANPGTAQRIVADGHVIANHTWNHPRLSSISDEAIRSEFDRTTEVIRTVTGANPVCYRPPYGATNARVHAQAVAAGLPNAEWTTGNAKSHFGLWDIDTNDWRLSLRNPGWTEAAMRRQLDRASDGDTILMHDGFSSRPRGLSVLAQWLAVNHNNYDFRVLPGCENVDPPGVEIVEPGLDNTNPAAWHRFQIARLYQAYFDRYPDAEGWEYWSREFSAGLALADISYWFAESSEFKRSAAMDDQQFVTFVYAAVLDREPDVDGLAYWVKQLTVGVDRGELVMYFSESDEYINRTAADITGGCFTGDVAESYRCLAAGLPEYEWVL